MAKHTVPHDWCECCDKRAFYDEHDARKALGRARTHRNRQADAYGTRRGLYRENRVYECPASNLYHLTSMSRRNVTA